ncbi:MAG: TIGR02757 family protein [Treponema sp.]|nr:TIGR02757 family protein [Treponema sp.]
MEEQLKNKLIELAKKYEVHSFIDADPSQFIYWYKNPEEIELACFVSAMLSFGSRKQFIPKIRSVLETADKSWGIKKWLLSQNYNSDFSKENDAKFYRFYSYADMNSLFCNLEKAVKTDGSLGNALKTIYEKNPEKHLMDIISEYFAECKIVSHGKNSAHKRTNMFLRWMVRQNSSVDAGLWNWYSPENLVIPMDVHVLQESIKLGLLPENAKADRKSAQLLTNQLKEVFPCDPCKGDFALFGLGVDENN